MTRTATTILLLAALACAAFAPAGQPNPKRLPPLIGDPDIDFALRELCFPWVKGEGSVEALTKRQGVVPAKRPGSDKPAWSVGQSGLTVALDGSPERGMACSLVVVGGDTARHEQALMRTLADWRTPLRPSVGEMARREFDRRVVLCAPKDGPQDALLMSIASGRSPTLFMASLVNLKQRDARCDAAS